MAKTIPLIRAAAMVPFVRWMFENGRPVDSYLDSAGLANLPLLDPVQPISVLNAAEFLRVTADQEGPDIGCRVVSSASFLELAALGRVALGSRTPRDALARVAAMLPHHCTHEHITLSRSGGQTIVREMIAAPIAPVPLHVSQQYVAALVRTLCEMTGADEPIFDQVQLTPHPTSGLAHLAPWFGPCVSETSSKALVISIADRVLDRPFLKAGRDHFSDSALAPAPLRADGTLASSVLAVLRPMLGQGAPTIELLSAAAGMSVRTLQRRLEREGTSFSSLLDQVRRDVALDELGARGPSIGEIAASLGYAKQASLTRAVRRWTGAPPRDQRRRSDPGIP